MSLLFKKKNTQGFNAKLMELPGQSMTGDDANKFNIDVQWCGVEYLGNKGGNKAGYPCTAPRVIVGNGDQAIQVSCIMII